MNVAAVQESQVQGGRLGRLVIARLKPNEDIIDSAEALCREHGIHLAVVRGGLGSLIDGQLSYQGREGMMKIPVEGPGWKSSASAAKFSAVKVVCRRC